MGKKHLSRWGDTYFLAERLPVTIFYSTVGSPAVEEVAVQSTTATQIRLFSLFWISTSLSLKYYIIILLVHYHSLLTLTWRRKKGKFLLVRAGWLSLIFSMPAAFPFSFDWKQMLNQSGSAMKEDFQQPMPLTNMKGSTETQIIISPSGGTVSWLFSIIGLEIE